MNDDLISREALKKSMRKSINERYISWTKTITVADIATLIFDEIDNAPTVEVPADEVNCVLTMFGKCSYNEIGCSDCEIKDKIRKALNARPQGEWIFDEYTRKEDKKCAPNGFYLCSVCCNKQFEKSNYCPNCGAKMTKEAEK